MDMPAAELDVHAALVARLVDEQHPDLADKVTLVANGWDNALFRLGESLSVRLPRREAAAELVLNEQRWLPVLAPQLPRPTPVPVRAGVSTDYYPWAWSITPWFEATAAAELDAAARAPVAAELAEFLVALHTEAPADAPYNPVRGVPLVSRTHAVHDRLAGGSIEHADEIAALWGRLVETPAWSRPPLWLHGDPHPANILLTTDASGRPTRLAAVIDFGDVTAGDPATDLAAAWLVFDAEARAAFRSRTDALAAVDDDTWLRARGWALNMGTAIAAFSDDNPRLAAIGAHALEQVLLDD
ncbi:aminoglycoside phosphotransferase family protein [Leifsonia sp. Root112D2]|uniref:aminoglycoside phosphotransferase family protein n=1 Tax=Leifsonia sp. Root112D2 TaxID=1736426 RepID=UPI0006FC5A96|nr:aminoglycoside phosphotransferase family protein [Leifsonia sp. Root112D2]KQV07116.1 phosphotransferase [Leifsonia sp. Root112D2]